MALQTQKSPALDDFQKSFALAQFALQVFQILPPESTDRAFFVQFFQEFLTNNTPPKPLTVTSSGTAVGTGIYTSPLYTNTTLNGN